MVEVSTLSVADPLDAPPVSPVPATTAVMSASDPLGVVTSTQFPPERTYMRLPIIHRQFYSF